MCCLRIWKYPSAIPPFSGDELLAFVLYLLSVLYIAHTPFPYYCCLLEMFLFGFTVNLFRNIWDYTLGVILGEKISHTIQDQM
jgi:hypothetical protein